MTNQHHCCGLCAFPTIRTGEDDRLQPNRYTSAAEGSSHSSEFRAPNPTPNRLRGRSRAVAASNRQLQFPTPVGHRRPPSVTTHSLLVESHTGAVHGACVGARELGAVQRQVRRNRAPALNRVWLQKTARFRTTAVRVWWGLGQTLSTPGRSQPFMENPLNSWFLFDNLHVDSEILPVSDFRVNNQQRTLFLLFGGLWLAQARAKSGAFLGSLPLPRMPGPWRGGALGFASTRVTKKATAQLYSTYTKPCGN